jgi:cation diffusion facilitator CzcD-associated flavoprotein CzcO
MNLLTALGLASMVFVIAFTCRAYSRPAGAGQSPRSAIAEAWLNILVGFSFNYVMNLLIVPLAVDGGHLSAVNNWWMGWIFTTVSIVRQYAIRRWVNARLVALARRLTGEV